MDPTSYAGPFFIAAMMLEAFISWRRRACVYRWNDTLSSIACGLGSQLFGLMTGLIILTGYTFFYERMRIHTFAIDSWLGWSIAIVGVDFIYYLWHRLSHISNFWWAFHVVHHQSEEYNFSTALRQSWFGGAAQWICYLPLAVLGVPPSMYIASYGINLLYQFILHTRLFKSWGPLEWILNTPSHHRVHHGSNRLYLDRNFAGMLIIWDRCFGTFQKEEEEVRYGLVKPLRSWDPVWANLATWRDIWVESCKQSRLRDKLLVWIKNPGWQPGDKSLEDAANRAGSMPYEKYAACACRAAISYVALQMIGIILAISYCLFYGKTASWAIVAWIFGTTISGMMLWEPLFQAKRWGGRGEVARNLGVLVSGVILAAWLNLPLWILWSVGSYLLVCTVASVVLMASIKEGATTPSLPLSAEK